MGSADFFMRHRALPWPVPSIRLRIWFVTVVLGAITLQIPGLRAQTTSTTEGIVADQQGLPVAGAGGVRPGRGAATFGEDGVAAGAVTADPRRADFQSARP